VKNFDYLEPTTVAEACALLKRHAGDAKVFAGTRQRDLERHSDEGRKGLFSTSDETSFVVLITITRTL
jgi:hypothetical protein